MHRGSLPGPHRPVRGHLPAQRDTAAALEGGQTALPGLYRQLVCVQPGAPPVHHGQGKELSGQLPVRQIWRDRQRSQPAPDRGGGRENGYCETN